MYVHMFEILSRYLISNIYVGKIALSISSLNYLHIILTTLSNNVSIINLLSKYFAFPFGQRIEQCQIYRPKFLHLKKNISKQAGKKIRAVANSYLVLLDRLLLGVLFVLGLLQLLLPLSAEDEEQTSDHQNRGQGCTEDGITRSQSLCS